MKYGKNITIGILSVIIIILFFYSYVMRMEISNIKDGFNDCYELMDYYADSSEIEKTKYEKIIEEFNQELSETNQVLRDYVKEK